MLKLKVMRGFELVLHRKKERILLREGFLVCKRVGVHFQVVAYKELATFQVNGKCGRNFFKML